MSSSILLLRSGDDGRGRVEELAAAMVHLGSRVAVEDLESGDYDRILDAVVQADTVIYWPPQAGD